MPSNHRTIVRRLAILLVSTVVTWFAAICVGSTVIFSPWEILRHLFSPNQNTADIHHQMLWLLRIPRATAALGVGAGLGLTGAVFQMLFRNSLAEPYVVGVSSGAALGGAAIVAIGFTGVLGGLLLPIVATAAALCVLALLLAVTRVTASRSSATLLLAGVVLGAMIQGALTTMLVLAGQDTNRILRWLLGDLSNIGWNQIAWLSAILVLAGSFLVRNARVLNVLAMGEDQAIALGVDATSARNMLLILGTLITATSVGVAGLIGFVGLVAPHLARRTLAVDARWSLIGAAAWGAVLLTLADLVAQRAGGVIQVPVGAVTAILGAPLVLWALRHRGVRLI